MPPHRILKECQEEFKKLNEGQVELKQGQEELKEGQLDIRDNHIKHLTEEADSHGKGIEFLKGRQDLIVKLLVGIICAVIAYGGLALVFEFVFKRG
jgi:hypothetical protein